jgi:hypothetical protein
MSHMQNEITVSQYGWSVETNEGTYFIPDHVASVPTWFAKGVPIAADDNDVIFAELCRMIGDYTGGTIQSIEALDKPHYFARLSAPGYLDCTEWCAFRTLKEARDYLRDL